MESGVSAKLECPLSAKGKRIEADIVWKNYVWEVKPDTTSGKKQLAKYRKWGGLINGPMRSDITEIPIIGNIKMGIKFAKPGMAWYHFYTRNKSKSEEPVKSTMVYNSVKTRIRTVGLITGGTLIVSGLLIYISAGTDAPVIVPTAIYILEKASESFLRAA